jgi:hypothetical protein
MHFDHHWQLTGFDVIEIETAVAEFLPGAEFREFSAAWQLSYYISSYKGSPRKGYRRQFERQNHMKNDNLYFALLTGRIKKKLVCQTSYG